MYVMRSFIYLDAFTCTYINILKNGWCDHLSIKAFLAMKNIADNPTNGKCIEYAAIYQ